MGVKGIRALARQTACRKFFIDNDVTCGATLITRPLSKQHTIPGLFVAGEDARRPVSRVLSLPCGDGRPFLWDVPCGAPHATNPGDGAGTPLRHARSFLWSPPATPIRSCSRWGLPCRLRHRRRGALLPHRFTLAAEPCGAMAVCFLWHFPWGRPRRPLTGTVFPWSPDFPPHPRGRSGRPAVWRAPDAPGSGLRQGAVTIARTAPIRSRVPRSASPVTASGRQRRWNAARVRARVGTG